MCIAQGRSNRSRLFATLTRFVCRAVMPPRVQRCSRELLNYELECVVAEIAARTPKGENVTDDQLVSRIPEDTWVSKSMPTLNSCLQGCCNRCGHTYDEHVKAAQEKAAQEHEAVKQQEIAALAAKGAARPSTAAAVPAESARSMRSARSARPPTAASASARQREAAAAIVKAAVARQTPRVATARSRVSASRRPSTAVRGGAVVDLEAGASARKPGTARAGDAEAQALDSARTSTPLKYDLRKPPQLFPPYVGEHYPLDMTSSTHAVTGSWINAAQPTHKLVAGVMKKASAAQHSEPVWVEGSGPCWKYVGGALGTGSAEMEVAKRKPIQQNRMFAFALDQVSYSIGGAQTHSRPRPLLWFYAAALRWVLAALCDPGNALTAPLVSSTGSHGKVAAVRARGGEQEGLHWPATPNRLKCYVTSCDLNSSCSRSRSHTQLSGNEVSCHVRLIGPSPAPLRWDTQQRSDATHNCNGQIRALQHDS